MYQAVLNVPNLNLVLLLKQLGTDNFNVRCSFKGEEVSKNLKNLALNGKPKQVHEPKQSEKLQRINPKHTLRTLTQVEVMGFVGDDPKVIASLTNVRSKEEHKVFFIDDMPFGLQLDAKTEKKRTPKDHFLCLQCGKILMKTDSMLAHAYGHIGVKQFPCSFCDKEYAYKVGLERHCKKQHSTNNGAPAPKNMVKPFICPICLRSYAYKRSFNNHLRIKHKNSGLPQPITTKAGPTTPNKPIPHPTTPNTRIPRSTTAAPIPKIVETKVSTVNKATCSICFRTFSTEKTLKIHFNNFHSSVYNFFCQFCFKGFYYKKEYNLHMKREFKRQSIEKSEKENIPPFDEFLRYINEY